jgi:hypothetical protein
MAHFSNFSPADCTARGLLQSASPSARAQAFLEDVLPVHGEAWPTTATLTRLRKDVQAAEDAISARGLCQWMSQAELGPWAVALMVGHAENGYPHTHGSVICLPMSWLSSGDAKTRVRLLVHERVHVFQRTRPEEVRRMLASTWGVHAVGSARHLLSPRLTCRLRSNPDLDGWLYADPERLGGGATVQLFDSDSPRDLSESSIVVVRPPTGPSPFWEPAEDGHVAYEHPFEEMAYAVAQSVVLRT